MAYTRYGHVNKVFVKVGDKVKKGQKIATNGTGNGQWLAHLHRDHPKTFPLVNGYPKYTFYNIGWTKQRTMEYFADPTTYAKALGKGYDHLGYGWLTVAIYKGGKSYHPGLDENGKGIGNADYDAPVYAVTDGVVEYVYDGNGSNGGWGRLIVVKEEQQLTNQSNAITMNENFRAFLQNKTGVDFGPTLSGAEQNNVVRILADREAAADKKATITEQTLRDDINQAWKVVDERNKIIEENDRIIAQNNAALQDAQRACDARVAAVREECKTRHVNDSNVDEIVGFIKTKDWKRAGWQIVNIAMAVIAAAGGSVAFLDDATIAQLKDAVNIYTISAGLVIAPLTAVAQFVTKKLNEK